MRIALIADVHANLAALDAVLADACMDTLDACWQLGDVAGYGPDPDAVIARLVALAATGVAGNHDLAAVGLLPLEHFNPLAAEASQWTADHISPESREYLRALPLLVSRDGCTLVHGTIANPEWEYLATFTAARHHFAQQETKWSFAGHTHVPQVTRLMPSGDITAESPMAGSVVALGEGPVCLNPGSVGQPRDGDRRAAYAILDTATGEASFHRVEYDIASTQQRMRALGLPGPLAARLALGR